MEKYFIRLRLLLAALVMLPLSVLADGEGRYIEVSGTAEVEMRPDEIHYIIEMKEYFEEEFDGKSKPEDYRTKVSVEIIEKTLRQALAGAGVGAGDIRTTEVGNVWRERGRDFLVSKRLDITLGSFDTIDRILKRIDTKGINAMYIGQLKNRDMQSYQRKGRLEALEAARAKAEYMAQAAGCRLGRVMKIVEQGGGAMPTAAMQSNVFTTDAAQFDRYRTIKKTYTVLVRYELAD